MRGSPYADGMSDERPSPSAGPPDPRPAARIDFDDPLDRRSADDSDTGWGDRGAPSGGSAADLARFLDEKPPHHV